MASGESGATASAAAAGGGGGSGGVTTAESWIEFDTATHGFSLQNIPWGVFVRKDSGKQVCGTRIGDFAVDLGVLVEAGMLTGEWAESLKEDLLNSFMGFDRSAWRDARSQLQHLFTAECEVLRDNAEVRAAAVLPIADVDMKLPARIGDYTDFYSSREHATNVGTMFRGKDNALQPNWLHLPVGYHGRASSVVVSGVDVRRPCGQLQADATDPKKGSVFGPCRLFDYEMEMAVWVGGKENPLGTRVPIGESEDRIFGIGLMNDWSARDIQKWEYVPLGPFTAKNVMTSVSPWIVSLDALAPFKCPTSAVKQVDPEPLPYLRDPDYRSYDVALTVGIAPEGTSADDATVVTRTNLSCLYWTFKQQLTHHAVTGCNMRPGDLLGTGTISGSTPDSFGSMLELSWKGSKEVGPLKDGSVRKFLKDGDLVVMRGECKGHGVTISFGEVEGRVLPADPEV